MVEDKKSQPTSIPKCRTEMLIGYPQTGQYLHAELTTGIFLLFSTTIVSLSILQWKISYMASQSSLAGVLVFCEFALTVLLVPSLESIKLLLKEHNNNSNNDVEILCDPLVDTRAGALYRKTNNVI